MKLADPTATAPIFPINHLAHFHTFFKYILAAFEKHNFLEEYASQYSHTRQFAEYKTNFRPPKGSTVETVTGLRCLDVLIQKDGGMYTT